MSPVFDQRYRVDHDVVVYEHGVLEPIPFLLLRYPLPWAGPTDWEDAAERAPVYADALVECREANRTYASDVFLILRELARE